MRCWEPETRGYNYDTTSIRLQSDRATTIRRLRYDRRPTCVWAALSSVVFCCICSRFLDILSLYLHPSLSSAVHLSATKSPSFAYSCSIWILLLPLVGLPFILRYKTCPFHRYFFCQMEFSICRSSFTLLRTSSLVTCELLHRGLNK